MEPTKGKRGGARPGAGRKPGAAWKPVKVIASNVVELPVRKRRIRGNVSVYVIGEAHEPEAVKFGLANDASRRLAELQIGTHRLLKLYAVRDGLSSNAARSLEATLHRRFRQVNVRGEWFSVSVEDAVEALNEEAERFNLTAQRQSI